MQKAVKISQRLTACQPGETAASPVSPVACPPVPEPMVVDSYRLSRTERARRLASGLCLYCGASGHIIGTCPSRPPRPVVSTLQVEPEISTLPLLPVQLLTHRTSFCYSIRPPGLGLLGKLHLPRPSKTPQPPTEKASPGAQDRNHPRKTAWAWAYQVPVSTSVSASGMLPSWDNFLSGTGGTHRGHHPGTPLAFPPFTRGQMGIQWDPPVEWGVLPELSLQCSFTVSQNLPSPSQLHPRGEPRTPGKPRDLIWLRGVPACIQ